MHTLSLTMIGLVLLSVFVFVAAQINQRKNKLAVDVARILSGSGSRLPRSTFASASLLPVIRSRPRLPFMLSFSGCLPESLGICRESFVPSYDFDSRRHVPTHAQRRRVK